MSLNEVWFLLIYTYMYLYLNGKRVSVLEQLYHVNSPGKGFYFHKPCNTILGECLPLWVSGSKPTAALLHETWAHYVDCSCVHRVYDSFSSCKTGLLAARCSGMQVSASKLHTACAQGKHVAKPSTGTCT